MKLPISAYGIALYDEIGFLSVDYAYDGKLTLINSTKKKNSWEWDDRWEHYEKEVPEELMSGERRIKPLITNLIDDSPYDFSMIDALALPGVLFIFSAIYNKYK